MGYLSSLLNFQPCPFPKCRNKRLQDLKHVFNRNSRKQTFGYEHCLRNNCRLTVSLRSHDMLVCTTNPLCGSQRSLFVMACCRKEAADVYEETYIPVKERTFLGISSSLLNLVRGTASAISNTYTSSSETITIVCSML